MKRERRILLTILMTVGIIGLFIGFIWLVNTYTMILLYVIAIIAVLIFISAIVKGVWNLLK